VGAEENISRHVDVSAFACYQHAASAFERATTGGAAASADHGGSNALCGGGMCHQAAIFVCLDIWALGMAACVAVFWRTRHFFASTIVSNGGPP
jgi:hypothetical protein